ncbi:16S rRNA (adenine1518-N6/adenine1519-N6)-dimethyltransferase [Balnearium lithotrophicum]|uniref:Ribosomal RNA small subunit methyltransferase A n=1 Tax=Balnearium lithotrophicum TaxID=223788 RepID=A0A521BEH2_9BACT|nr:16S rRNA (adenine(1518)-N(6)/adenine(1519)-N(6))-dimethyltransferase RsmA [Balnearium lithotrophicum]SMO45140.1 16S rRNA (adenine1518-N6/adenine1519-N6)-dimethyltransferase [Balnearium lithotrophicum]
MKLKKRFGQHFLRDRNVIRKIVDSGSVSEKDRIVEIGPGGGALTEEILSRNPKELLLIEVDPDWVNYLKEKFGSKVKIVKGDATKFPFSELPGKWKFFGNLPYNVSTAIIRNLLRHRKVFDSGVFMVQKEVADRLTSRSGKNYGYLPALLSPFFKVEKLFDVHPKSFIPPPKVFSTVIRITPTGFSMEDSELTEFEEFLKRAFSQRRKKLKKNVELPDEFKSYGEKRAEEVSPDEFLRIFRALKEE